MSGATGIESVARKSRVCFAVPPAGATTVIRDYAGGLGFEADPEYTLPPLDLMQLAGSLGTHGLFEPVLVDAVCEGLDLEGFHSRVEALNVDVIIITVSLPTLEDDLTQATLLSRSGYTVIPRLNSDQPQIVNRVLRAEGVALCLIGECEDTLPDILVGRERRGTAVLEDGEPKIYCKEPIQDLDVLPLPRRDLAARNRYSYPKLGECATLVTSRGCPYSCKYYCPYPLSEGRRHRTKSIPTVLDELEAIHTLGTSRVFFRDAVFTLTPDRAADLCGEIIRHIPPTEWWCETRADLLPSALLDFMSRAGCKGINIGVESGDPDLRFSRLKRGVSDETISRVVSDAQRCGIGIAFLLMVGFPGETRHSIVQTAALLRRCRPENIGVAFPVPHPGTELERDAAANGWIVHNNPQGGDGSVPVLAGPGLDAGEMLTARRLLLQLFDRIRNKDASGEANSFAAITAWAEHGSGG